MAADPYAALARQTEPADPTEAEYQAFCDALMDDERGRWFLAEFTRRNRNADTGLLLKALDRIEALVQLGSPDVFARLQQELRAILETIRASRAEAAADEIGETAKLLVLLAQIERRIDGMIGEPARAIAPAVEIAEAGQSEARDHLAVVPTPALETAQPAEDTTASALMPPLAWTEPLPSAPATAVPETAALAEPAADATLADMQPAAPVNENEPQATYLTEPVTQQSAGEGITDEEVARAIAEWTATSAVDDAPVAESASLPVAEIAPTPMALGDTHSMALDSAAEGFALPDAAALTEPEPLPPEPAVAVVETVTVIETPPEQPQTLASATPEIAAAAASQTPAAPHVFHAGERPVAPYEFEPLAPPAPAPAPAEAVTAQATPTETGTAEIGAVETSALEAGAAKTGAIQTSVGEPAATATPETAAETPATPPVLDTLESRMAAANALAALAGLSEEERIALFT